MYRPVQAWQWMVQTRSVPEQDDWVRPDVSEAWLRCLEEYHLPLGNFANWDKHLSHKGLEVDGVKAEHIAEHIEQLSHHFQVFLQEAGVMMVVVAPNGSLLYVAGEQHFPPLKIRETER
ncbi:hypothetical protein BAZMOX_150907_0 [methanotrophic endosymbiont of Bathymodiolus azoricus (Menez Gwen)]|nr:hypothetical protein BAZMOX_150907_0 [methanotrophic endosymbiont of Bathymodiolus azoricus (Menez Gwen)]